MRVTILFFILCLSCNLYAAHIIGGDMTYTCVGNNEYIFTMTVYRDCDSQTLFDSESGGTFETIGTVTIFDGLSNIHSIVDLDAPIVESISTMDEEHPCPENLNICIEKGTYTFTAFLPMDINGYDISYQRCCRTASVNNISDPQSTGFTLTTNLGQEAQTSCNSTPVFNQDFSRFICVGETLSMDLSATDNDGDELRYFFTEPFRGGGLAGSAMGPGGGATDINGIAPNPDAPPPYASVNFIAPLFTAQTPLAGDPIVSIDSLTGIISGTPEIFGQFVLAVTVEEYRAGNLLSSVQREIQINVVDCDRGICVTSTNNTISKDKRLRLYPNPSTGIFSIVQTDYNIESYKVYDLLGNVMIQDQRYVEQIDLSNFSAGIYIVQVLNTKGKLVNGKVVKQ